MHSIPAQPDRTVMGVGVCVAGNVTPLGREMSHYPLDPPLSRVLIESTRRGCVPEALTIAAVLSVESVYFRPPRRHGAGTRRASVRENPSL